MQKYTIFSKLEVSPLASIRTDAVSYSRVDAFIATDSFDAIDQAAAAGYTVKAGDRICLSNGFTITHLGEVAENGGYKNYSARVGCSLTVYRVTLCLDGVYNLGTDSSTLCCSL